MTCFAYSCNHFITPVTRNNICRDWCPAFGNSSQQNNQDRIKLTANVRGIGVAVMTIDADNIRLAILFRETKHAAAHQIGAAHQQQSRPAQKNSRSPEITHVFPK